MMSQSAQMYSLTPCSSSYGSSSSSSSTRVFSYERDSFVLSFTSKVLDLINTQPWDHRVFSDVINLFNRIGLFSPGIRANDLVGILSSFDELLKTLYMRIRCDHGCSSELTDEVLNHKNRTIKILAQRIEAEAHLLPYKDVIPVTLMLSREYLDPCKEDLKPAMKALENRTREVTWEFEITDIIAMFTVFHKTHNLGGECETALWLQAILKAPHMTVDDIEEISQWVETSITARSLQETCVVSNHIVESFTRALRERIIKISGELNADQIIKMLTALDTCNKNYPIIEEHKHEVLNALASKTFSILPSIHYSKFLSISVGFCKFPDVHTEMITDLMHQNAQKIASHVTTLSQVDISRAMISLSGYEINNALLNSTIDALAIAARTNIHHFNFRQNYLLLCGFAKSRVRQESVIKVMDQLAETLTHQLSSQTVSLLRVSELLNHLSPSDRSISSIKKFSEDLFLQLEKSQLKPKEIAKTAKDCTTTKVQGLGCRSMMTFLSSKAVVEIDDFEADDAFATIIALHNSCVRNEFTTVAMNAFAKKLINNTWVYNEESKRKIRQAYIEYDAESYYFKEVIAWLSVN